jgi:hypothetical protein
VQAPPRAGDEVQRARQATRSLLTVDCGSIYTKVALLGHVEGRYRLLACAQSATTVAPPIQDVTAGVRDAIAEIERITGRALLRDGQVLMPQSEDGLGVDGVAVAASVGGPLRALATGPGRDALAGLLHRAIGGLFVQLDALPGVYAGADVGEWQQALAQVRAFHPHALLVIGSAFGGGLAQGSIEETAGAVSRWLDALREQGTEDASGATHGLPVVLSATPDDAQAFERALHGHAATVQSVEPLSPSTLTPLNRVVSAFYEVFVLRGIPGYAGLRALSSTQPAATLTSLAGTVRYLAQYYQSTIVGVDVGANATELVGATAQGEFLPAVHPAAGVGPGASYVMRASGAANVQRWLAAPATEDELREYVLTRMLRPRALPATPRELEFEHALAREAIALTLRAPGSRLGGVHPMDVVLGTGGVLANVPHPALAVLLLLDALQPRGITSLVLDTAQLSGALGSIAALDTTAAAEVATNDALVLQLGTVISPVGVVPEGQPVLRAVLDFADGRHHVEDIVQGTLVRLPIRPGEQAMLGLFPAPGVDVGLGPGQQARASDPVEGGAVGLIVDARGRPLALPLAAEERGVRLLQWRRALGLEG